MDEDLDSIINFLNDKDFQNNVPLPSMNAVQQEQIQSGAFQLDRELAEALVLPSEMNEKVKRPIQSAVR